VKVLVLGANGGIGRRRVGQLDLTRDVLVRAMVRKEEQVDTIRALGAEVVLGDLEGDFARHLDGCDAVVFSIGSGGSTGLDKTLMVDLWGARRAVDAAVAAKVKRFVMVSSLGAGDPLQGPESLRPYLVAKRAADDHLEASGLDYTIVRPGQLLDDPGNGRVRTEVQGHPAIPRDDVAATIEACLVEGYAKRRTFELVSGDTPIPEALAAL